MEKKKILVIDDEADLVELIQIRLEAGGHEIITANDGLEGLLKIAKESPDLIILDISMTPMDGYTMLQKVREDEKSKNTPVIMLTAHEDMKNLFEMEGVVDYIVKPFDPKDFLSRVEKILKKED